MALRERILIVEDEASIQKMLRTVLSANGYEVIEALTGAEALSMVTSHCPDVILLDLGLPDMDGNDLLKSLREWTATPVIVVSARTQEMDKVTGLTLGADDYMTKPFLPLELVARVKAQLRRYKTYNQMQEPEDPEGLIIYGGLVLDVESHECTLNERPLVLTPTEFAILRILCEHKGGVVSAEELFRGVWGEEYYDKRNNTISVHIRHLREKLGDSFDNPRYIKTVWGCGYKIEP